MKMCLDKQKTAYEILSGLVGLGDVYKRQIHNTLLNAIKYLMFLL